MKDDLDTKVRIGPVTMARWVAGRDCYDAELDPGHGYLVHQSLPRFTARWCVGGEVAGIGPKGLVYADVARTREEIDENATEGSADLALYDFVWIDDMPGEDDFRALMDEAVEALDRFIGLLNEEYE